MLRLQLYVGFSTLVEGADLRAVLSEHLDYMVDLERRGLLFASGPFLQDDGTLDGSGMTVVRAADRAEAETILMADPFHRAGLRTLQVRAWLVNEGSMALTLSFSTSRFTLE